MKEEQQDFIMTIYLSHRDSDRGMDDSSVFEFYFILLLPYYWYLQPAIYTNINIDNSIDSFDINGSIRIDINIIIDIRIDISIVINMATN